MCFVFSVFWVRAVPDLHTHSMSTVCPQCYMPDCPRAASTGATCCAFTPNPSAERLTNGDYPSSFRNTLPIEVRNVDGVHIDNVYNYASVAPALATLTTEEQGIANDLNTVALANLGHALVLADKRPALRSNILQKTRLLLNGGPTGPQTTVIQATIEGLEKLEMNSGKALAITSTSEYKQVNYPLSQLLQTIVKGVEKGTDVIPDQREMLDVETGKKYIPFDKSTKASSDVNLMYSIHIFVITSLSLRSEAPKVYHTFANEIRRACASSGHVLAHEYADALLRSLDTGVYGNIRALFASGEHNRIYDEVRASHRAKRPEPKDTPDPRKKIKFGPVTQPLGGKGAGVITDFKTGDRKKCTRYHASPQQACTAGIPAGDSRFTPDQVGLCAFSH